MTRMLCVLALSLCAATHPLASQSALVLGAVEDSTGRGIPQVQISILGVAAASVSDSAGRFRFGPLRPSTYILQFRRLGYTPVTAMADLTTTDTLRLAIELAPAATSLATVNVTATSTDRKLEQVGFVRRRMDGTVPPSRFITRAEFEARPPLTMTELLRRMGGFDTRCQRASVYVDGALLAKDPPRDSIVNAKGKRVPADGFGEGMKRPNSIDAIPPTIVGAVEAYTGPAEIPLEFKAAGRGFECVVLVWTRAQ